MKIRLLFACRIGSQLRFPVTSAHARNGLFCSLAEREDEHCRGCEERELLSRKGIWNQYGLTSGACMTPRM
jgi:hypothetical protein